MEPTTTASSTNLVSESESVPIPIPIQSIPDGEYVMYKRRWIGLAAIFILNVSTSFVWLTFNAVPQITANWLNTGLTEVNLTVILYFIGYITMSPFSGYAFERFGLKKSLLIGSMLNIIGTSTRYFASFIHSSQDSYQVRLIVVLIGQFIAAMSQPYFLNSPPKYAAMWFSDKSRALAITIGSMSNPVAAAFAMVLIPIICDEENGDKMPLTLLIIVGMAAAAVVPTILMPAGPPTPPSPSAEQALAQFANQPSFWKSLKTTTSNKYFIILWIAFAISVGLFNTFSSLMNQIVTPYGYSDDTAGIFGATLIISGVIGATISSLIIDKYKKYILVLRICSPIVTLTYIGFIFIVYENNVIGICIISGLLGFVSFALLPVALELGVECTYPIPPSSSTALLWMGGQLCAVLFLIAGNELRNDNGNPPKNMKNGLIGAAGFACVSLFVVFFYNFKNKRLEAELNIIQQQQQNRGEQEFSVNDDDNKNSV